MKTALIVAALVLQVPTSGQTTARANDYWKYAHPQRKWCLAAAGPRTNLFISQPVRVDGTVSDEIEKPVTDSDFWVTVKDLKTNRSVASVRIAAKGHFDLGMLDAGDYYLRVQWAGHGVLGRLVDLDKPKDLTCLDGTACHLDVFVWLKGGISHINECSQVEGTNGNAP